MLDDLQNKTLINSSSLMNVMQIEGISIECEEDQTRKRVKEEQYWGADTSRYTVNMITSLSHDPPIIYEIIDGSSNSLKLLDFFIIWALPE